MGVSIHYRGRLDNSDQVYQLIEEIKDIAEINAWSYATLDQDWNKQPDARLESASGPGITIVGSCGLKGIHIQPDPKSEALWLYFNAEGVITTPFSVALSAAEGYPMNENWVSTKTQFAGVDIHITFINLLKYIKKKYVPDLEVKDEGRYWESENREVLQKEFDRLTDVMKAFKSAL